MFLIVQFFCIISGVSDLHLFLQGLFYCIFSQKLDDLGPNQEIGDIKGACLDAQKVVSLGDENSDNKKWIKENC